MPIEETEIAPGFPVLNISHALGTARIALHGGHVMEWTPAGHAPVLYLSPQALFRPDKAIRGGIPLCWPWFGPAAQPGLPAHGFARTSRWTLCEAVESADGVKLTLTLADSAQTRALWPHAFRLTLTLHIGRMLDISLRAENPGADAVPVTGALHSYFSVGDARQATVHGLDGAEYLDESAAGAGSIVRQTGPVTFRGEVDRDYASSAPVCLEDPVLQREIHITGSGSGCTVVWNPWTEKGRAMADLPDEDYLKFVCVETANAWQDRVTIPAGGAHTLAARIDVRNHG